MNNNYFNIEEDNDSDDQNMDIEVTNQYMKNNIKLLQEKEISVKKELKEKKKFNKNINTNGKNSQFELLDDNNKLRQLISKADNQKSQKEVIKCTFIIYKLYI